MPLPRNRDELQALVRRQEIEIGQLTQQLTDARARIAELEAAAAVKSPPKSTPKATGKRTQR
jgi:hypothetical protein